MTFAGEPSALTTILTVSDLARSKSWYLDVLGADDDGEYGGRTRVGDAVLRPGPDRHLFEISAVRRPPASSPR